jgi:cell division protein FtsB
MSLEQLTAFGYGVALGLLVALWFAFGAWRRRRELVAEVDRLRRHLHDHMEISREGAEQRKGELEQLRKENENLRVTVKAWQQKPDRQQLRSFLVYDRAVRELTVNAPGFGTHWESALRHAEAEVEKMDQGLLAFARRLILPSKRSTPDERPPEEEPE